MTSSWVPSFLPVPIEEWYLIQLDSMDNTSLPLLKDGNPLTCETTAFSGNNLILKATRGLPFKSLRAIIIVLNDVNFGPSRDPSNCGKPSAILLTHDSSQGAADGQACGLFCAVPETCHLEGLETLPVGRIKYYFSCECIQQSCNELFMWFRPEIGQQNMAICEIQLKYK